MKSQKTFECSFRGEVTDPNAADNANVPTKERVIIIFQKSSSFIKTLWSKFKSDWDEAGEIQSRIDATRAREIHKYDCFRWHI